MKIGFLKKRKIIIDKMPMMMYTVNTKRQYLKRSRLELIVIYNNRPGRGGYCAFIVQTIIVTVTVTKTEISFLRISAMLMRHKHPLLS